MVKTNPNEPIRVNGGAWSDERGHTTGGRGLTKREYFAAMAMQGLVSKDSGDTYGYEHAYTELAVGYADALIEELNKEANNE